MRQDSTAFRLANTARDRRPRFVISILFDVGSVYCTSHTGIAGVPGIVLQRCVQSPSAVSQRLVPDEGRAEIGALDFEIVDLGSEFTDELRAKLDSGRGLRNRTVQMWKGYEGQPFSEFVLDATQIVVDCEYSSGVYSVRCQDITRAQRKDIFEPKKTTLRASVSATDTTIPVYVTSEFLAIQHGSSWSDAPGQACGYIRISNEWIRWTGKTADSFTGCTRGVLNTVAAAHAVDAATAAERRTTVEEVVYLELPAVKLAYAVLTGTLYGSANTIPPHWHLGISPTLIRESDFTGIGLDLWNPADDNAAIVLRFEGLKKQDGKRFLEREIFLFLGVYSPVYANGSLGLRRMAAITQDASPVMTLTEREIVQLGQLQHDFSAIHNRFRIDWSWNGERFARSTAFIDGDSVATHGEAPIETYEFRGVVSGRHTDAMVMQALDAIRDRYAEPPQRISITVLGSLDALEVGDVVRLNVANLRDFAGSTASIDRAFEIQQRRPDYIRGTVSLDLFGSTLRPTARPPTSGAVTPLPDAFYNSAGVALSTLVPMTGNTVNAGTYNINGATTLGAAGSIVFHLGDLTIPSTVTINITGNVQLRVRGFLTMNGVINGVGGGLAGTADPGGVLASPTQGNPGYVGNSRGGDGVNYEAELFGRIRRRFLSSFPAALTRARNDAFPLLQLQVVGNTLLGLPGDLRGTGGGPGGRVMGPVSGTLAAIGSAGAAGGAGLAIICRGMSFGVSSTINLSGLSPTAPAFVDPPDIWRFYPGAGGGGGPGALLILLDGNQLSVPNVEGRFIANTGTIPLQGTPLPAPGRVAYTVVDIPESAIIGGYPDPGVISGRSLTEAARRIQYVPESQAITPDADSPPPRPLSLVANAGAAFIQLLVGLPSFDLFDVVEFYVSITNNRASAVLAGTGRVSEWRYVSPPTEDRWFWARTRRTVNGRVIFSEWFPASATAGVQQAASALGSGPPGPPGADGAPGAAATAVFLTASANTFRYDRANAPAPGGQVVTLTASRVNIATAATWSTVPGGITLGGAGDVRTLSIGDFGANDQVRVRAEVGALFDEVTIVRVRNGAEAVTGFLSNEAHVLPANASGGVLSYAGASGVFRAFYGADEVTSSVTFSIVDNPQALTITGPAAGSGAYSITGGFDAGEVVATVTFRAALGALTVDRVFSLTKSTQGATGAPGADGDDGAPGPTLYTLVLNGVVQTGNALTKGAVADGWNASAHSVQAYRACFVTARAGALARAVMFGLNADPTTDSGFASIDFAWYFTQLNDCRIFENGSEVLNAGAYTTATVLSMTYDGRRVQYLRDGVVVRTVARPGLTLAFDSSFFDNGAASLADVAFGPQGPGAPASGNLLDLDQWVIGAVPDTPLGNFIPNNNTFGESAIVLAGQGAAPLGPYGTSEPLWECRPGASGDASGGFINVGDIFSLDPKRAYRARAWFYMNPTAAAEGGIAGLYLGCGTAGDTRDLGGGVNFNPYFAISNPGQLEGGRWYLFVGVIFGDDYTGGQSGVSGVYDPRTGRLVPTVNARADYRMTAGVTTQGIRAFPFYFTNTSSRIWISRPAFEVMDGREPTIASLLVSPDSDNTDRQRIIPDAEIDNSGAWSSGLGVTFFSTGGTIGGYLRLDGDLSSSGPEIFPIRERGLKVVPARQWMKVTVRSRQVSSVNGAARLRVSFRSVNYRDNRFPTGGDVSIFQANVDVAVWLQPVGTWVESTHYVYLPTANPTAPYLFVIVDTQQWKSPFTAGITDIDYIDVEPSSAPGTVAASLSSTASSYTVQASDLGGVVQYDSASAGTFTIELNEIFDAPVGSIVGFLQRNTGALTIAAAAGVTLLSPPNRTDSRTLLGRYARAAIVKLSANTWSLDGSLAP